MQLLMERLEMPLTVRPEEAAKLLSVSRSHFDEHVLPYLKVIRSGRLVLVPVAELEAWIAHEATALPLGMRLA